MPSLATSVVHVIVALFVLAVAATLEIIGAADALYPFVSDAVQEAPPAFALAS